MSEIKNYGVWAADPISYVAQTEQEDPRSPHITLKFKDESGKMKQAAINVKSTDKDSRLVYWYASNLHHPITESLKSLGLGFHLASKNSEGTFNLDYIRTTPNFFSITDGQVLPTEAEGPDNDVADKLKGVLDGAIAKRSTIYIFGSSYNTGIHDIHMNQGSLPKYANGAGTDGAIFFYFPDDGRFEAVFLAFASQRVPTDDKTGEAVQGSQTLADIIEAGGK